LDQEDVAAGRLTVPACLINGNRVRIHAGAVGFRGNHC
jgi:hypothetical protein